MSSAWDPHTAEKQINNIEGVQRRFIRSCHDGTPGSVIRLLNERQCPSLDRKSEGKQTHPYV